MDGMRFRKGNFNWILSRVLLLHSYKNGFSVTTIKLCEEDEKEEEEQEEKEEEGTMMNMEKVTSAS